MNKRTIPLSLMMAVMMLIMMPSFCLAENMAGIRLSYDPQDPDVPVIEEPLTEGGNGIPVIYLTIDEEEFEKVWKSGEHTYRAETGSIRIEVPEGYPESGTGELNLDYIRGRGNSTWKGAKRPFRFKLNKKAGLLGMDKSKHWVLLANDFDATLLRNRIIEYTGTEMGLDYTMESRPVDLVVNGTYRGSYTLCEQIRVDDGRVEIDEISPSATAEPEITGGYLLEMFPGDGDEHKEYMTTKEVYLGVNTPDFSEYTAGQSAGRDAQSKYIFDYIQNLEDAIYSEDFSDADGVRYSEYMDLASSAKYWWIQEFSGNGDGFQTSSTYLYKDRNGKLYWGPLWDFDLSLNKSESELDTVFNNTNMPWLDHMRAYDPEYQKILLSEWERLDGILDNITRKGGVLDTYAEEIRASRINDTVAYRRLFENEVTPEEAGNEFEEAIERLRNNIDSRRKVINDNLDDLFRVFGTFTFMDGDETLKKMDIRYGYSLRERDIPPLPEKEGSEFVGWYTDPELTEPFDLFTCLNEDITVYAKWSSKTEPVETQYKIEYRLNGGRYKGSSETIIEEYPAETEISIHEAPVRDGYEFMYWMGSEYQPGDKYTVTSDHVFTARWKKLEKQGGGSDTGSTGGQDGHSNGIGTGDNSHPVLWILMTAAAVLGLTGLLVMRRRRE